MSDFKLKLNNTDLQIKVINRFSKRNSVFPPVIMLHDSLGCIELWRDFPEKVSAVLKTDVYTYDRQGYGKSDPINISSRDNTYMDDEAHLLIKLMDMQAINKAILFGHSDGATIALLAAANYPERIQAVISEAAHVFVEDVTLKGIERAVYTYNTSNFKLRLEKYHGDKTDLLFSLWYQTWLNENFRNWNMIDQLTKIQCPVLIIQGENDEFGTLKQLKYIEEKTSGYSEACILKETGHSPHKEHPEMLTARIFTFLEKHVFI